jgi:hypothetical protein
MAGEGRVARRSMAREAMSQRVWRRVGKLGTVLWWLSAMCRVEVKMLLTFEVAGDSSKSGMSRSCRGHNEMTLIKH